VVALPALSQENRVTTWGSPLRQTNHPMQLGPRGMRFFLNLYPPYLFSRTRVKYIAPDWKEIIVELHKSLLNRNYVGTTFGGSLYAASDPFFMLMLIKILGIKDHIVWDKGAKIDFKKPARSKITYRFLVTEEDLQRIYQELETKGKSLPEFLVEGKDKDGEVCVSIHKLLYIRKKSSSK
jgi:hypothetical protein